MTSSRRKRGGLRYNPPMYWIVNATTNGCLEYVSNTSNTTSMNAVAQIVSRSQLWYVEDLVDYDGYARIRNVDYEDRALDFSAADSASILAYTVTNQDNQRWKISPVDFNG